jgi:hypothetical protein
VARSIRCDEAKNPPKSRAVTASAEQGQSFMSKRKATIGRRQLLRAGMTGLFAATASSLEPGTAAADTESNSEKRKARFQPNSAEVQNFYRVNRYPKR